MERPQGALPGGQEGVWRRGLPGLWAWLLWGAGVPRGGRPRPPLRGQMATAAPPAPPGSLEEVVLAVHALAAAEAALGQGRVAVAALQALAVPVAVQGLEDEAVQDVLVAAGAQRDLCKAGSRCGRAAAWSGAGRRGGGKPPPVPAPRPPSRTTPSPSVRSARPCSPQPNLQLKFRKTEPG